MTPVTWPSASQDTIGRLSSAAEAAACRPSRNAVAVAANRLSMRLPVRTLVLTAPVIVIVVVLVSTEGAGVVDHVAVDHRKDRTDLAHVRVADPEVVAVEHDEVGQLALLDRAEVVLAVAVPGRADGVHAQRLLARDLLARIDLLALRIGRGDVVPPGRRVMQREPRVVRRDVDAVLVQREGD